MAEENKCKLEWGENGTPQDPKPLSRQTIADGLYIQKTTMMPNENRDEQLKEWIEDLNDRVIDLTGFSAIQVGNTKIAGNDNVSGTLTIVAGENVSAVGNAEEQSVTIGLLDEIDLKSIKTENLSAKDITADNITADNIDVTDLTAENAEIENLSAADIETTNLSAENIETDDLTAENANIENLSTENANIENLSAENLSAYNFSAENGKFTSIEVMYLSAYQTSAQVITAVSAISAMPGVNSSLYGFSNIDGGNITASAKLNVSGDTTLKGKLDVDKATTLNDTLDVVGSAGFDSDVTVDGTAIFNSNVQLISAANTEVTSFSSIIASLDSNKMDKVVNPTEGNIAILDGNGNVIDGGKSIEEVGNYKAGEHIDISDDKTISVTGTAELSSVSLNIDDNDDTVSIEVNEEWLENKTKYTAGEHIDISDDREISVTGMKGLTSESLDITTNENDVSIEVNEEWLADHTVSDSYLTRAKNEGSVTVSSSYALGTDVSALGAGSVAFGSAAASGKISTDTYAVGAIGGGFAYEGGTIASQYNGTLAIGQAQNYGTIYATAPGSMAHGYSEGAASQIRSTSPGSFAQGEVHTSGIIAGGGNGSIAAGIAVSSSQIIGAAPGSLAIGVANTNSNIIAGASGAMTHGYAKDHSIIIASGVGSFAGGYATASGAISAAGNGAFAVGASYNNSNEVVLASGNGAIAMGIGASAIAGNFGAAVAIGREVIASGQCANAQGYQTSALGNYSHAEGRGSIASGEATHAIGSFNTFENAGQLFIVGNGEDNTHRNDAMVLSTDNDLYILGNYYANGVDLINNNLVYDGSQTGYHIETEEILKRYNCFMSTVGKVTWYIDVDKMIPNKLYTFNGIENLAMHLSDDGVRETDYVYVRGSYYSKLTGNVRNVTPLIDGNCYVYKTKYPQTADNDWTIVIDFAEVNTKIHEKYNIPTTDTDLSLGEIDGVEFGLRRNGDTLAVEFRGVSTGSRMVSISQCALFDNGFANNNARPFDINDHSWHSFLSPDYIDGDTVTLYGTVALDVEQTRPYIMNFTDYIEYKLVTLPINAAIFTAELKHLR